VKPTRRREHVVPEPVHQLSRLQLIQIIRDAAADPARWTQLERMAYRELSLRN
jgi:hypothetical protein